MASDNKMTSNLKSAFSLIELMIVIAIVSILSSIAIPQYRSYLIKNTIMDVLNDVKTYQKQIEIDYATSGGVVPTLGVANGDALIGPNPVVSGGEPLVSLKWYYEAPYPNYSVAKPTLLLLFNRYFTKSNSNAQVYLRLILEENNGILTWQCRNYGHARYQVKPEELPSHCY